MRPLALALALIGCAPEPPPAMPHHCAAEAGGAAVPGSAGGAAGGAATAGGAAGTAGGAAGGTAGGAPSAPDGGERPLAVRCAGSAVTLCAGLDRPAELIGRLVAGDA